MNEFIKGLELCEDFFNECAKSVIDKAKSVLGIHSPSKKFAWIGKMCLEGFNEEFEDFDPYASFNASVKANKAIMTVEYNAGIEAEYGTYGMNYDKFGDSVVDSFVRAGITVKVNNRTFGRIVRSYE